MAKIILAEDEGALAGLIAQVLSSSGHTVTVAPDGQQAWEALDAHGADLVLSDLLMPVMSGYALLEKIRADERFKTLPCVVLSNSGQIDDLNRAYQVGANDVLIKTNFNPAQLMALIAKYLPAAPTS